MELERAGVIGDDAAGVDDHALHARALPVVDPPPHVVVLGQGVDLADVRLSPAHHAPVPGLLACCFGHWRSPRGMMLVCWYSKIERVVQPSMLGFYGAFDPPGG